MSKTSSGKSKQQTSLTREQLLELFEPEIKRVEVENFGVVYLRPRSEVKRCRRVAEMFDDAGKIKPEPFERRRIYAIVDHVCDEKGIPVFSEQDVRVLAEKNGEAMDSLYSAIEEVFGGDEKND